ncbi:MAG TPA: 1-deoxy-D-xylulose-5-phosphate reductoisomerase [Pyrinomonadaceae bacterium]|nr:1-deoxy-D-xylulose-5-phosphate reductoisomerase [Pyrinomonadaceae bacterium]
MTARGVSILGSTGSIGCNTLRVIEALGGDSFRVVALGAGRNIDTLAGQIEKFKPQLVSVKSEETAERLRIELGVRAVSAPTIRVGEPGLVEVATRDDAEIVVSGTVGAVGFVPTLRALEAGKRVALANKETLVMAGELMTRAAEKSGAEMLPVDSEHNALHQCLRGEKRSEVRRLILTASGGPFRKCDKASMESASVAEALKHPTWNMGAKITIDSATLMNKGLEVIEAHWLFRFDAEQITIVVHPESVVHSMIELVDGSIIAQLGVTDMRHAIQYALTYPERHPSELASLDFTKLSSLNFEPPDLDRFPCISLAYRALKTGGTTPAALNAANEEAVRAFIEERINLTDIPRVIEAVVAQHARCEADSLEAVLKADASARAAAAAAVGQLATQSLSTQSVESTAA